ncbi:MAG: hypothetical protein IIA70_07355 [Proteobacteria bacterium]|nr:hypothetical protein [Pseudomonadota bacterium]
MKFEELNIKGLTRSYKVVVAAQDVEDQINADLEGPHNEYFELLAGAADDLLADRTVAR